ncbi:MAG: hypothetical protein A2287_09165 [Candidatus Melainabacteria bacterium RIFOXYA12_FULL_32_12]|nr:MAG: hypothetical protein A2287_09165 [Candidatus Melainabacteria bacterium RIFOXYA12_FULL_32_12]
MLRLRRRIMSKQKIGLIITLASLIILFFLLGARTGISLEKLQDFIRNLGFFAPLTFILIYTIVPIFFVPITPLSVTAGVLFGPVWGTIYTVIGATLGACATFLVSRYLVKDWVDKRSSAKVIMVQELVRKEGWKFVAIARITPVFPFNFQNYVFGVTDISFRIFFWATFISIIPGSFTYVYLGYAGKVAFADGQDAFPLIIIAVILLLLFSMLPYIIKKIKLIIKKKKEVSKSCIML